MTLYVSAYNACLPSDFLLEEVSKLKKTAFIHGSLHLDRDSEFFPGRSDEKIMRSDVKMAIVAMRSMLSEMALSTDTIEKSSLFVANGAFIEDTRKYLDRTLEVYKSSPKDIPLDKRLKDFYRVSPPLLALETLTNLTMSFIAQYIGLRGNNTTYGNTSISAFYCLQDAMFDLKNDKCENAFVCASNCSGNYSFLMNSTISENGINWKESAGVGCLALKYARNPPENARCKITHMNLVKKAPSLTTQLVEHNWKSILPEEESDLIIFSGAFTDDQYAKDLKYIESIHSNSYSLFLEYGNLGPANILLGIIHGIQTFETGNKVIDIVDRDIYGRESHVRIEAC